jgi:hypothetical protein
MSRSLRDLADKRVAVTHRDRPKQPRLAGPAIVEVRTERIPINTFWVMLPTIGITKRGMEWRPVEDIDAESALWVDRNREMLLREGILRTRKGYRVTQVTETTHRYDDGAVEVTTSRAPTVIQYGAWV